MFLRCRLRPCGLFGLQSAATANKIPFASCMHKAIMLRSPNCEISSESPAVRRTQLVYSYETRATHIVQCTLSAAAAAVAAARCAAAC